VRCSPGRQDRRYRPSAVIRHVTIAVVAIACPLAAHATDAGTVIALSPAQVEAAKEAGAARHARDAALGLDPAPHDRAIHGEVGFAIGTGGYSAIYGTAIAPLGDKGVIALSIADQRFGRGSRYRR
jgi:hypothetical protein